MEKIVLMVEFNATMNNYKSKRKIKSYRDPKIGELVHGFITHGSPKTGEWLNSNELSKRLIEIGGPSINSQELGQFLTADGFVKKRFGVTKPHVVGYEDSDFNWKIINKWRVTFIKNKSCIQTK